MLDSQDSVAWSEAHQSLTFTLSNVNAYNAYKFMCYAVVDIDDTYYGGQLDMAEWSLVLA